MENWIEKPAEPLKLFLAWQAPDNLGDRYRWAVGVLEPREFGICLRYFKAGPEFEALNAGKAFEQLLKLGYRGYPGFNHKRESFGAEEGVSEALMRRVPARNRSDFEAYKRRFRIAAHLDLSPFALLGQTEAKLPSDGFSVVDPLNADMLSCDLLLEVAGYRYYAGDLKNEIGDPVEMAHEPANKHDRNAIMMCVGGQKIGYLNRLQAPTFLRWLAEREVSAVVERLNGAPERPRAFIFVRIRPRASRVAA